MSQNWSVTIIGIEEGYFITKVASSEDDFLKTTVKQLKQKIYNTKTDVKPENMRLLFAGRQLEDLNPSTGKENTLRDYNIQKGSTLQVVVRCPGGPFERVQIAASITDI